MTDKEAIKVLHRYQRKHWVRIASLKWELGDQDVRFADLRVDTITQAGQHVLEVMPLVNRIGRKNIKKIIAMLEAIAKC